jgi:hypothetical protein
VAWRLAVSLQAAPAINEIGTTAPRGKAHSACFRIAVRIGVDPARCSTLAALSPNVRAVDRARRSRRQGLKKVLLGYALRCFPVAILLSCAPTPGLPRAQGSRRASLPGTIKGEPGKRCRAPAVRGWKVCRMHGARGGAPEGKRNGNYKHGARSKEVIALTKLIKSLR